MKNLVPTLKVRLRDDWKGTGAFIATLVLLNIIFIAILPLILHIKGETTFAASGFISSIYVFVIAIISLRQYLRLCIQNGTGRKTMFTSHMISGIVTAVGLGIFGEFSLFLSQVLGKGSSQIYVSDVYYMLFKDTFMNSETKVLFTDRLLSIMTIAGILICVYAIATFISTVLFRIPKPWTYIVGFGVPFILFNCSPFIFMRAESFARIAKFVFDYALASPYHLFFIMIIVAAVFSVFSWLVVRRTPIKAV